MRGWRPPRILVDHSHSILRREYKPVFGGNEKASGEIAGSFGFEVLFLLADSGETAVRNPPVLKPLKPNRVETVSRANAGEVQDEDCRSSCFLRSELGSDLCVALGL